MKPKISKMRRWATGVTMMTRTMKILLTTKASCRQAMRTFESPGLFKITWCTIFRLKRSSFAFLECIILTLLTIQQCIFWLVASRALDYITCQIITVFAPIIRLGVKNIQALARTCRSIKDIKKTWLNIEHKDKDTCVPKSTREHQWASDLYRERFIFNNLFVNKCQKFIASMSSRVLASNASKSVNSSGFCGNTRSYSTNKQCKNRWSIKTKNRAG